MISTYARVGSYPSVAWNGSQYLVVWKDFGNLVNTGDICGARVTPEGEVIDPLGIPIRFTDDDGEEYPSVSWDGVNFFVTWRSVIDANIMGARVTPEGDVLDTDGIDLGAGACDNQKRPASASDGANTLVVWELQPDVDNWDICGRRVDSEGNILGSRFKVSIGSNSQTGGSAGWDGSNFLVVWQDMREGRYEDLYGVRVDTAGEAVDPAAFAICRHQGHKEGSQIAFDGENFLVVWQDLRDGIDWDIYGTLVSPEGLLTDTAGFAIATASGSPGHTIHKETPALDFSGESYLVVWLYDFRNGTSTAIQGRRIGSGGDLMGSEIEFSTDDYLTPICEAPDIAWGDTTYLVVFSGKRFDWAPFSIWGRMVSADGSMGDKFLICGDELSLDDVNQSNPAVAWGEGQFLVVWKDNRNGDYDVYGARVSAQGAVLDSGGVPLVVAEARQEPMSLIYDGVNYLLAWMDDKNAYCTRVSPQGTALDPQGIRIFTQTNPENGLKISSGPPSVSLMAGSRLVWEQPYSSPRVCGAFFLDDPAANYPPQPFSLISPEDGDTVIRPALLDWEEAQDPDPEDDVCYDLYVSTSPVFDPDSTITLDSLLTSQGLVYSLDYGVPYYWKVTAYDQQCSTSSEQTWSFDVENHGDANGDGTVDMADAIYLLNYLFRGGDPPTPLASGDQNGDGEVDIADVIYLLNYLFKGGPPPGR